MRKGFNREEGNRFGELPRCRRNRKNVLLLLFTVKNGKEGGRYALNTHTKRCKPGDLPCFDANFFADGRKKFYNCFL